MTSIGQSAFKNTGWYNDQPDGIVYAGKIVYNYKGTMSDNTQLVIKNGTLGLADYCFSNCTSLSSISLPNSLVSIGIRSFWQCIGINNIKIPNSVTTIGEHAFYQCKGLTSVNIPNSVTEIGKGAFDGCKGLTSVTIPNSVTTIGNRLFGGCSGLTSITIPNSVTSIGYNAFEGCSGLTSVIIPNSVTTIGDLAFSYCTGLISITIPESVTSISKNVFNNCSSLTKVIINSDVLVSNTYSSSSTLSGIFGELITEYVFGEGIENIGQFACYNCSNLTSVSISDSVSDIGISAFENCSSLTSVTIGNSVTSIGNSAFSNCRSLTSITIPNSVTIGSDAFNNCNNIKTINVSITDISGNNILRNCVPNSSLATWNYYIDNNLVTSLIIPDDVSTIGEYALWNCNSLISITIPESVTSIGQGAFQNCKNLTSIKLPVNITSIGNNSIPSSTLLYVSRGAKTLLALWNRGYFGTYEIGTEKILKPSSLVVGETTQMTATVTVDNFYSEYENTLNDNVINESVNVIKNLRPEYSGQATLKLSKDGVTYSPNPISYTTKSLNPTAQRLEGTASSMVVKASYTEGDANVTSQKLIVNGVAADGDMLYINGLRPNTNYYATYTVKVDDEYEYTRNISLRTDALKFVNEQPKVISEGNVVVASQSNLDGAEESVGFQWRRTDWTEEFASNSGRAYLYEGLIEGYIRNLNTSFLWKFRPYYEANDGSRYYGDWLGIDPTNTSYFEPTVHTYNKASVKGNTAEVKGYAQRGSDNISQQGFKYWTSENRGNSEAMNAPRVPSYAQTIESSGTVMEAELKGLYYDTEYYYVAFVKTSEGEIYYGEAKSFRTGLDPTGIEELTIDNKQLTVEEGIYDLSGRKLARMQKGINIIRFKDGTTKKVLVK